MISRQPARWQKVLSGTLATTSSQAVAAPLKGTIEIASGPLGPAAA